jgi:hypothetical protein
MIGLQEKRDFDELSNQGGKIGVINMQALDTCTFLNLYNNWFRNKYGNFVLFDIRSRREFLMRRWEAKVSDLGGGNENDYRLLPINIYDNCRYINLPLQTKYIGMLECRE